LVNLERVLHALDRSQARRRGEVVAAPAVLDVDATEAASAVTGMVRS
jgi:hypothetical protein